MLLLKINSIQKKEIKKEDNHLNSSINLGDKFKLTYIKNYEFRLIRYDKKTEFYEWECLDGTRFKNKIEHINQALKLKSWEKL